MRAAVDIRLLREGARVPEHAKSGDAGFDLRAADDAIINPLERIVVPCGFSIAIPAGFAGLVLPRSGISSKHGITLANAPGLIDSNYRGEVMVSLVNLDPNEPFEISAGDRIAQLLIIEVPEIEFLQRDCLDETERGGHGFGSSGTR